MTTKPTIPVADATDPDQHHREMRTSGGLSFLFGYALTSLPLLRAGFALIALVAPPAEVGVVQPAGVA